MAKAVQLAPRSRGRSQDPRVLQISRGKSWLAVAAAIFWLAAAPAPAQDNEGCFRCHDDAELTAFHGDEEVSAYVDEAAYAASVHADMACVDCHADLAGSKRRRHAEDLEPVDCERLPQASGQCAQT